MKTIIDDVVARMNGKPELQLPKNTIIRFEFNDISITCKIDSDGLRVQKTSKHRNERIVIHPSATNMVYIK